MATNWYFTKDGHKLGPFGFDQLRQLAASGVMKPNDVVWNEVASIRVSADQVPGLMNGSGLPALHEPKRTPTTPRREIPQEKAIGNEPKPATEGRVSKLIAKCAHWFWVIIGVAILALIRDLGRNPPREKNPLIGRKPVLKRAQDDTPKPPILPNPAQKQHQLDHEKAEWLRKQQIPDPNKPFLPAAIAKHGDQATKGEKLRREDIIGRWTTGKDSHTLVLTNTGQELKDVVLQITMHERDGFKFTIPAHWDTWLTGEAKVVSVAAHNYPMNEIHGSAVKGATPIPIDVVLNWVWNDGVPSIK